MSSAAVMALLVCRSAPGRQAARSTGTGARGTGDAGSPPSPIGRFLAAVLAWQPICTATRHATKAHAEERGPRFLRVRDRSSGTVLQPAAALLVAAREAPHARRARRRGAVVPARTAPRPRDRRLVPSRRLHLALLVREPVRGARPRPERGAGRTAAAARAAPSAGRLGIDVAWPGRMLRPWNASRRVRLRSLPRRTWSRRRPRSRSRRATRRRGRRRRVSAGAPPGRGAGTPRA